MNFFNNNNFDPFDPLKNYGKKLKKKIIIYAAIGFSGLILSLMAITLLYMIFLGPIQAVMTGLAEAGQNVSDTWQKSLNFITFNGFNTNEETFYNTIIKKNKDYSAKGVTLDVPLIVSVIFYDKAFEEDANYQCTLNADDVCINPDGSRDDYAAMRSEAATLSDNMVKTDGQKFYCTVYQLNSEGNAADTPTKNYCGDTKAGCSCSKGTISSEIRSALKTPEEYKLWLKESFLSAKLVSLGYEIPTDKVVAEALFDSVIAEIYARSAAYSEFVSGLDLSENEGSYGHGVYDAGLAGNMSASLMSLLGNPLGDQSCRQSQCFGYYSKNLCIIHKGVDVAHNPGAVNNIYSIGDGEIIAMDNYTKICELRADGKYPKNCSGRVITIKHNLNVDGQMVTITSSYNHLASFADESWIGIIGSGKTVPIVKGQLLGIMGTTGVSTGVHLHFALHDVKNNLYNPEQLLAAKGCSMHADCNEARSVCGSK